ncbi:four helix bundle protein [Phaeocystidibacter marisrubri]|uniref:Four helix bundle protein n=1 Tax=Phaeocystidibacter marisrubri TaxID=1577780 RepID=A0A6L3ZFH8_9FLAO|nr:four helix bundle protein [Phaeocystidibacter marisrubri]KAB2816396.1 four helix bundle protein [Phaeocystidibacter marisrubri]GGH68846.1 four helix bundle protein [Phaeocystidibacter marisrubri]
MATIKHFKELNSWKSALLLFQALHSRFRTSPKLRREYELKNQIIRASLSIMNNIAEGFGRKSNKEFLRFLSIARGSCFEVESMIYAMDSTRLISPSELEDYLEHISSIKGNLAGLSKYLHSISK